MKWVRPQVYMLAKTQIQTEASQIWLNSFGVSVETQDKLLKQDRFVAGDAAALLQLAGRRCYKAFEVGLNPNVTQVRSDIAKYIDNIFKSGHGSVAEHCSWTFAIENVSRVFTGEMNRHRAGVAISEGSMRYIRFDDIPICETPCLRLDGDLDANERDMRNKTRTFIAAAVEEAEKNYGRLSVVWKDALAPESKFKGKKEVTSMLRRIVPMGVATGGLWTFNLRSLRHVCELRSTEQAEEEIREVVGMMLVQMKASEPILFSDFYLDENGFWTTKYHKV